jgi:hypothetical protein
MRNLRGLAFHDTWVGKWLGHAGAMVRVVSGWLVNFWSLWHRIVVAAGCIGYTVVMVVADGGYSDLTEVVGECGSLVEVVEVGWC